MHIQLYFITNSLFRHQKLASNLHFLRLAQLFFLFETYSVSFLQKAYFYAKNTATQPLFCRGIASLCLCFFENGLALSGADAPARPPFVAYTTSPSGRRESFKGRAFQRNLQGSHGSLEFFHAVGVLPLHAQILAAHVAVSSQLAVDGPAQIQVTDDGCRG